MDNDIQLVGVRRTDKQLLTAIVWRMQYRSGDVSYAGSASGITYHTIV